jgi:hypothetical protein
MQAVYQRASVIGAFVILLIGLLVNAWLTNRQVEKQIVENYCSS